jgi:sulfatase maturation enzyme AslB (radical SAM superfamily)
MGYAAVTAFMDQEHIPPSGIIITAVLPGGCNLGCPVCIVNKRDERREKSYVTGDHLIAVLDAVRARGFLGGAAIVGDEPLQDHCWPTAKAFLHHAIRNGRSPTAIITNGYNLIDFADQFVELRNTKVVISLDGVGKTHDELRQKAGAFARIQEGIAVLSDDVRERLAIASILMPSNLHAISEIIDFTAAHLIPQLLLSPLLTSGRDEPLTVHPKVMREAWRTIPHLLDQANEAGVKLRLSDEFAMLGQWGEKLAETGIEIMAPKEPARLIRVDAAGRIETLVTMQAGTTTGLSLPRDPGEIDGLVDGLLEQCFAPVRQAA